METEKHKVHPQDHLASPKANTSLNLDAERTRNNHQKPRISSPLRMKYQAEVQTIIRKWGDLENIRKQLGLSKRKISQLLLVDPSAWTRWTKNPETIPPHIYRALSWFLILQEKNPEAHPYYWLATVSRPKLPKTEIEEVKRSVMQSIRSELRTESLQEVAKSQGASKYLSPYIKALFIASCLVVAIYIVLANFFT